jgi:hypothetical protein
VRCPRAYGYSIDHCHKARSTVRKLKPVCCAIRMGITPHKRRRIHESLSFGAAVETDAGEAVAAHTDGSKVRAVRHPGITGSLPQGNLVGLYSRLLTLSYPTS